MRLTNLLLIVALGFSSCVFISDYAGRVDGTGDPVTITREVGTDFTGVSTSGIIEVMIKEGPFELVKIQAEENLLELIKTEVKGATLKVYTEKPIGKTKGIKVWVSAPVFEKLMVSGAGELDAENTLHTAELIIDISGAGDVYCVVETQKLDTRISGAGDANVSGSTERLSAGISGSGSLDGLNLVTKMADIAISGAGSAKIHALQTLDVDISGAGSVKYKGSPEVKKQISGAGSLRQVD